MNTVESLALFAKGRDKWNAWAREMLARRDALGEAFAEVPWNSATQTWHREARADFSGHTFEHGADFSGFIFPGYVGFSGTTFKSSATFRGATFESVTGFGEATLDTADFSNATFNGNTAFLSMTFAGTANFTEATFTEKIKFKDVKFAGHAIFRGAKFGKTTQFVGVAFDKVAHFNGAIFDGLTYFPEAIFAESAAFEEAVFGRLIIFDDTQFNGPAEFRAMEARTGFSLAGVRFVTVPDFIQAHFGEAPRLDRTHIETQQYWRISSSRIRTAVDHSARWRALKRLAIQGHDHIREQEFFKGELQARRWIEDKPWHAVFWFGFFYQVFSDFGRSLLLPLLWWIGSLICFAGLYVSRHPFFDKNSMAGITWVIQRLVGLGESAPEPSCVVGPGDPLTAALTLSAHKGLLSLGPASPNKLNQIYACLYGTQSMNTLRPGQVSFIDSPIIPDGVTGFGFIQYPLSAALIFLFLLAIRNRFRIK